MGVGVSVWMATCMCSTTQDMGPRGREERRPKYL